MKKGILALVFILSIFLCCSCDSKNNDEVDYDKELKNSFIDIVINYGKAAETAYVSDSLKGNQKSCYSAEELQGEYISENDDITGKIVIEIKDNNIIKRVTLTDGINFYVDNVNPIRTNIEIKSFNYSDWNSIYEPCN